MLEWIKAPWPWYVAGPLIVLTMFLLLWAGRTFGVSSTLRTVCAMGGGGKCSSFFQIDWRKESWNLVFVLGGTIGGFLAQYFLMEPGYTIDLSGETVRELQALGIAEPGKGFVPPEIFSWGQLLTLRGMIFMLLGGFLIGFGARYAGGCTSGHAISGLSNLQLPSLIAVIGFFVGGLLVTHLLLPYLMAL